MEGTSHDLYEIVVPEFVLVDWEKPLKPSGRIASVPAYSGTRHLVNYHIS